jgi:predicted nucleotidyltransferase
MMMEIQFMPIDPPKGSTAYIFGSALETDHPNDLDVLIVYEQKLCPTDAVYDRHKKFVRNIEESLEIEIDCTFLSEREEKNIQFISSEDCILLNKWIERKTRSRRLKD